MGFGKVKFEKERKPWETEIKKISLAGIKRIYTKKERENGKIECRIHLN